MNGPFVSVAPFAPAFQFRTAQHIAFGRGARDRVAEASARLGARVLLVVGGRSLATNGELQRARDRLASARLAVAVLSVDGEPDVAAVDRGALLAREHDADVVLAIGGGSVLDAAKAIAAITTNGGSAVDFLEDLPGGAGRSIAADPLPVVAVPTTAGTGSEVTRNAVLRVPQAGLKRSMRDDRMIPRVAIVDPELASTSPQGVAVPAALDALTHLIEAYVSLGAQPTTDLIALEGARRLVAALRTLAGTYAPTSERAEPRKLHEVRASDARSTDSTWDQLALASLWGGIALANAGLGAVHGLVAPLGGRYSVPHGAACAALLAPTIRANVEALRARDENAPALSRYAQLARAITDTDDPMQLAADIDALRVRLGARSLVALGVEAADLSSIVGASRGGSMKNNPVVLTDAELETILKAGMEGWTAPTRRI